MEDYIEDIKLTWPERGIVKDPFANKVAKSIGLEQVSRFWDDDGYRLTFNDKTHPMAMPFVLFAHDLDGKPRQVKFKIGESVVSKLEEYASAGWTMFVSSTWLIVKNVIWKPYWTREQVMIDLELKGV